MNSTLREPSTHRLWPRIGLIALLAYVVYACAQLDVS